MLKTAARMAGSGVIFRVTLPQQSRDRRPRVKDGKRTGPAGAARLYRDGAEHAIEQIFQMQTMMEKMSKMSKKMGRMGGAMPGMFRK